MTLWCHNCFPRISSECLTRILNWNCVGRTFWHAGHHKPMANFKSVAYVQCTTDGGLSIMYVKTPYFLNLFAVIEWHIVQRYLANEDWICCDQLLFGMQFLDWPINESSPNSIPSIENNQLVNMFNMSNHVLVSPKKSLWHCLIPWRQSGNTVSLLVLFGFLLLCSDLYYSESLFNSIFYRPCL